MKIGSECLKDKQLLIDRRNIINYYEAGDKRNPLIICLHGLAGNSIYTYSELSVLLDKDFHLIMLDLPGHGGSSSLKGEDDYLFSSLAQWLQKVIKQITIKPFYIMGHSWGADLALHYTRYHPADLLGIILLDGGFTFPVNQPEMTFDVALSGWDTYMDNSTLVDWDTIIKEYKTYTKQWNNEKEEFVSSLFRKEENRYTLISTKFTVISIIKAFFLEPFTDTYPSIRAPLLLIHATYPKSLDKARLLGIHQIETAIKDVTIFAMEHSGHMLQWDEPEQTAIEIKKWILEKEYITK